MARADRLRQQRKEEEARALLEEQERRKNASIVVRIISVVVPTQYQPTIKQFWHDSMDYSNKRYLESSMTIWKTHVDPLLSHTPLPKIFRVIDIIIRDKIFLLFPAPYRTYENMSSLFFGFFLVVMMPLLFCRGILVTILRLANDGENHSISTTINGTTHPLSPNKTNESDRLQERSPMGLVSPTSSEGSIDADPEVTPMKPALIKRLEDQLRVSTTNAEELLLDKHALEKQLEDLAGQLKVSRDEAMQRQADVDMATSGNFTCFHAYPTNAVRRSVCLSFPLLTLAV